jgi:hypothetical protein
MGCGPSLLPCDSCFSCASPPDRRRLQARSSQRPSWAPARARSWRLRPASPCCRRIPPPPSRCAPPYSRTSVLSCVTPSQPLRHVRCTVLPARASGAPAATRRLWAASHLPRVCCRSLRTGETLCPGGAGRHPQHNVPGHPARQPLQSPQWTAAALSAPAATTRLPRRCSRSTHQLRRRPPLANWRAGGGRGCSVVPGTPPSWPWPQSAGRSRGRLRRHRRGWRCRSRCLVVSGPTDSEDGLHPPGGRGWIGDGLAGQQLVVRQVPVHVLCTADDCSDHQITASLFCWMRLPQMWPQLPFMS